MRKTTLLIIAMAVSLMVCAPLAGCDRDKRQVPVNDALLDGDEAWDTETEGWRGQTEDVAPNVAFGRRQTGEELAACDLRGYGLEYSDDYQVYDPNGRPDNVTIYVGRPFSSRLTRFDISGLWLTSSDIVQLKHMTDLTELRIWNNKVCDISVLSGLTNLSTLSLGSNQISDLTPLSGLTNLTRLIIFDNQISDLAPLSGLTNLTELVLSGNRISDLTPLAGMTNLTRLELDSNLIRDLSPLSGLMNLKELSLIDNQISDITPLSPLADLVYLDVSGNPADNDQGSVSFDKTSKRIAAKVGGAIEFGGYGWRVLDVEDGHALIIAENAHLIGVGLYNFGASAESKATWETSTVREYLNHEFLYRFSPSDRSRIRESYVVNERNPRYGTNAGRNTTDRVFLLSISEVVHYFGDSGQLHTLPDDILERMYISDMFDSGRVAYFDDGRVAWTWLRSPGGRPHMASVVDGSGTINIYGSGVSNSTGGVRPVMWVRVT